MKWTGIALLALLLAAGRGAAAQDEATIKGAFIMCGVQHVLIACDDLVKMPDLNNVVRSNAYGTRAATLIGLGRVEEAKRDLDEALRLNPSNSLIVKMQAMLQQAESTGGAGDLQRCETETDGASRISACDRLVASEGSDTTGEAAAFELRAKAYLDAGQFDKALADLDAADRLRPNRQDAALHRIEVLTRAGDYPKALQVAHKAIAGSTVDDPDLFHAEAELLYLTGDREGAVKDFEASYKAEPTAVMARYWSAIVRMELKQDASADLRALLSHPMMSPLGAAIIRLRLHEGGEDVVLNEAKLSGPDAPCIAEFNIGHDAWLRGDKVRARTALQAAIDTGRTDLPEYRAAKLVLSKLVS